MASFLRSSALPTSWKRSEVAPIEKLPRGQHVERSAHSNRLDYFARYSLHSAPNPHIATSERTRQEYKLALTRNIRLEQPQHSRPTPASSLWKSAHKEAPTAAIIPRQQ